MDESLGSNRNTNLYADLGLEIGACVCVCIFRVHAGFAVFFMFVYLVMCNLLYAVSCFAPGEGEATNEQLTAQSGCFESM